MPFSRYTQNALRADGLANIHIDGNDYVVTVGPGINAASSPIAELVLNAVAFTSPNHTLSAHWSLNVSQSFDDLEITTTAAQTLLVFGLVKDSIVSDAFWAEFTFDPTQFDPKHPEESRAFQEKAHVVYTGFPSPAMQLIGGISSGSEKELFVQDATNNQLYCISPQGKIIHYPWLPTQTVMETSLGLFGTSFLADTWGYHLFTPEKLVYNREAVTPLGEVIATTAYPISGPSSDHVLLAVLVYQQYSGNLLITATVDFSTGDINDHITYPLPLHLEKPIKEAAQLTITSNPTTGYTATLGSGEQTLSLYLRADGSIDPNEKWPHYADSTHRLMFTDSIATAREICWSGYYSRSPDERSYATIQCMPHDDPLGGACNGTLLETTRAFTDIVITRNRPWQAPTDVSLTLYTPPSDLKNNWVENFIPCEPLPSFSPTLPDSFPATRDQTAFPSPSGSQPSQRPSYRPTLIPSSLPATRGQTAFPSPSGSQSSRRPSHRPTLTPASLPATRGQTAFPSPSESQSSQRPSGWPTLFPTLSKPVPANNAGKVAVAIIIPLLLLIAYIVLRQKRKQQWVKLAQYTEAEVLPLNAADMQNYGTFDRYLVAWVIRISICDQIRDMIDLWFENKNETVIWGTITASITEFSQKIGGRYDFSTFALTNGSNQAVFEQFVDVLINPSPFSQQQKDVIFQLEREESVEATLQFLQAQLGACINELKKGIHRAQKIIEDIDEVVLSKEALCKLARSENLPHAENRRFEENHQLFTVKKDRFSNSMNTLLDGQGYTGKTRLFFRLATNRQRAYDDYNRCYQNLSNRLTDLRVAVLVSIIQQNLSIFQVPFEQHKQSCRAVWRGMTLAQRLQRGGQSENKDFFVQLNVLMSDDFQQRLIHFAVHANEFDCQVRFKQFCQQQAGHIIEWLLSASESGNSSRFRIQEFIEIQRRVMATSNQENDSAPSPPMQL